jgi:HD-like signal output (HDOD) protein/ActR/RegA family two-component response regulator
MTKARILFVDDEVAVLDGLRDLLRKERGRWDMVFANGGEQALEEFRKAPFDLVITDMRMPGMDGAELLAKVKELYPGAARMVLSGHAAREAVLRAVPVAQQFLAKPCEAQVLRTAIDRTYGLNVLLSNHAIRDVVGKLEALPSVPRTYLELTDTAARRNSSIDDLAAVVEQDPAMSAKVLQLVNSAYFGAHQRVASIRGAVSYLGVELLKGLALASSTFAAAENLSIEGFSLERLRSSSLLAARAARRFIVDRKLADEAFTTALVHEVGKIVIALGMPAEYASVLRETASSKTPVHLVEKERFGVSHAEVGAYLLGVWGLPFSIVEAVAFHHHPGSIEEGACDTLAALHVASALIEGESGRMDHAFLSRTGFEARLPRLQVIFAEELAATGAIA